MRVILVHNPSAGVRGCPAEELVGTLRAEGLTPVYLPSKEAGPDALLGESADLVAVAGGDGTVARIATILPGRGIPFTVLPMGTMNNIASTLGIDGSPRDLARGWRTGRCRPFDVWVAEGPWGRRRLVEGVGLGALAQALSDVEGNAPKRRRGRDGRLALHRTLTAAPPDPLRLTVDGRELAGEWLLVEMLNIAFAGPGLQLAPRADPGDGLLDLMCLAPGRRTEALDWLEVAEGRGPAPASVRRCRSVRFDWDGRPLRIDDSEPDPAVGRSGRVEVTLDPAALTVLMPGTA